MVATILTALAFAVKPAGITKLGSGDVILGNPLSTEGPDPGFKTSPIFELSYEDGDTTPDDKNWEMPDGSHIDSTMDACQSTFTSKIMSGTKSYQKHLQESASVEGEGWGAKFKASADFKKQESTDSSQRTVTVMSDAFCEVYSAKLMLASGPKLSDHFIAAVAGLPDAYDKDMYYHFIKDWGTHFVGYMLMGGRYGKHHYFTESGFAQMESHDLNIKAAAQRLRLWL